MTKKALLLMSMVGFLTCGGFVFAKTQWRSCESCVSYFSSRYGWNEAFAQAHCAQNEAFEFEYQRCEMPTGPIPF